MLFLWCHTKQNAVVEAEALRIKQQAVQRKLRNLISSKPETIGPVGSEITDGVRKSIRLKTVPRSLVSVKYLKRLLFI